MLPDLADIGDLSTLCDTPVTDGHLKLALRRASDRFRGATKRPISLIENDQVWVDGDGTNTLLLPSAPIVGTPVVVIADAAYTDFSISRDLGVLRAKTCWPDDLGNIQVTYTHGFAETPGDIQDAVLEQAQLQYQVLAGISQMTLGPQSFTFGPQGTVGVTQRWAECVARYRLYRGDRS